MSTPDTAAYDRLYAKQASFDNLTLAAIDSSNSEFDITSATFITVHSITFRTSGGIYLSRATANNETFSGTIVGDQTITGNNHLYIGTTTPGYSLYLRAASSIFIGANSFPLTAGIAGQVLMTNGSGLSQWGTIAGAGTVTSVGLTSSSAFITVSGASPITASGTYNLGIGTLPPENGGTGATTVTGSGSNVLNTNPFLGGSTTITNTVGSGAASILYMNRSGGGGVNSAIGVVSADNQIINSTLANELVIGTGSGIRIYGAGQVFLKSDTFINIDGASTRFNNTTYVAVGTGTLGGNGFSTITCPVGSGTIRAAGGPLFLGSDAAGVSLLSGGGAGIFANSTRLDGRGFAMYVGSGASVVTSGAGFSPYRPTVTTYATGTSLTYTSSDGHFTNATGGNLLVTASYSLQVAPGGSGINVMAIELNGASSAGTFLAANEVLQGEWASGSSTFLLTNTQYFKVILNAPSGPGGGYDASCSITCLVQQV